eukprot:7348249-Prymnesium_polylepis.1
MVSEISPGLGKYDEGGSQAWRPRPRCYPGGVRKPTVLGPGSGCGLSCVLTGFVDACGLSS